MQVAVLRGTQTMRLFTFLFLNRFKFYDENIKRKLHTPEKNV